MSTELATLPKIGKDTILPMRQMKTWLELQSSAVAKIFPAVIDKNPDRYARCLLTMMQGNYKLARCNCLSLVGGMIQSIQLGLELGGALGQTYLVPRYNSKLKCEEATFQVGYKGFIALGFRSDKVGAILAQRVFEADEFDLSLGSKPNVHHKPKMGKKEDRGVLLGCYATVKYVSGIDDVEWMTREEIYEIRARFAHEKSEPWNNPITAGEMEKKTVMRRLCKRVAVSVAMQQAASLDEAGDEGQQQLALEAAQVLDVELPEPESDETQETAKKITVPVSRGTAKPPANPQDRDDDGDFLDDPGR